MVQSLELLDDSAKFLLCNHHFVAGEGTSDLVVEEDVFGFDVDFLFEVEDELVDAFFVFFLFEGEHGDGGGGVILDAAEGEFEVNFAHGGDALDEVFVGVVGGEVEELDDVDVFELSDFLA